MTVLITINDLTFNEDARDAQGIEWSLGFPSGWFSPEVDQSTLPRLSPGSSVVTRVRHRTLVMFGAAHALTDEGHWAACHRLETLVPVDSLVDFIVHEQSGAMRLSVQAGPGNPRIDPLDGRLIEFQLTLIAPDPVKQLV